MKEKKEKKDMPAWARSVLRWIVRQLVRALDEDGSGRVEPDEVMAAILAVLVPLVDEVVAERGGVGKG